MAKKGTTKYFSNKQEKDVAKQIGGKTVIASGALWHASSDVRNKQYLVECKTTEKSFYTITSKAWEKICKEAVNDGFRDPLLVVDLHNNHKERYVCFPFNLLPFDVAGNTSTPLWLKGNITTVTADGKQFRFFGVAKHCATVVTFCSRKGKVYNSVVLMQFKDFKRLCEEVLNTGGEENE